MVSNTKTTSGCACSQPECEIAPTISSAYEFQKNKPQAVPLPLELEQDNI
jgi:hypothetical protein